MSKFTVIALFVAVVISQLGLMLADQGCPFDNGSCQQYCNQQSCGLGYCGHFAWIQCICRKCGDEWSYYDKIRFTNNKTVNQTELESIGLKLSSGNQSSLPMIVIATNNINGTQTDTIQTELLTFDTIDDTLQSTNTDTNSNSNTDNNNNNTAEMDLVQSALHQTQLPSQQQVGTTATTSGTTESQEQASGTLLVPDLTEMSGQEGDDDTDNDNNSIADSDATTTTTDNSNNNKSNDIDDGTDTDRLLELAERHYNKMTSTTSTTPAPQAAQMDSLMDGLVNKRRKQRSAQLNSQHASQVTSLMYRI